MFPINRLLLLKIILVSITMNTNAVNLHQMFFEKKLQHLNFSIRPHSGVSKSTITKSTKWNWAIYLSNNSSERIEISRVPSPIYITAFDYSGKSIPIRDGRTILPQLTVTPGGGDTRVSFTTLPPDTPESPKLTLNLAFSFSVIYGIDKVEEIAKAKIEIPYIWRGEIYVDSVELNQEQILEMGQLLETILNGNGDTE